MISGEDWPSVQNPWAPEFLLDLNFISNINHYKLAMRFAGDSVEVAMNESCGLVRDEHVTGKRQ